MTVTAFDAAGTLTVRRGAHGLAMHAAEAPLLIYTRRRMAQVCLRVAAWLYRQKDAGWVQQAGGLRGQVVVRAG